MKKIKYLFFCFFVFWGACSYQDAEFSGNADAGTGGSMARFTVVGDHLFTVDNENLKTFDISSNEDPQYKLDNYVGSGVETIFPFGDKLFLGTSNGMYIYEISNEGKPSKVSFYEHVIACDPVVSDGNFAYVTLSSTRESCWRAVDELQIIDLANIANPQLIKQYEMENPRGLAVRNDTLWVCDNGIKIFDVSDKNNIQLLYNFNNIQAYDIILDNNRALVVGESGFVQYQLQNDTIILLSTIDVKL